MSHTTVATALPTVDRIIRNGIFRPYTDDVPNRRSIRSVHVGQKIIKMVAAGKICLVEGLSLEVLALWDEEATQYVAIRHKAVNVLSAFLGYTDIIISEAKSSGCCFIDDDMLFSMPCVFVYKEDESTNFDRIVRGFRNYLADRKDPNFPPDFWQVAEIESYLTKNSRELARYKNAILSELPTYREGWAREKAHEKKRQAGIEAIRQADMDAIRFGQMERDVQQALKELETWDKERLREEAELSTCSQETAKKEVEQLGQLYELDSIELAPLELNSVQETLGFLNLPLVSITTVLCTILGVLCMVM